jgi:hypothetical protein
MEMSASGPGRFRGKSSRYPLNIRLGEFQRRSWLFGSETNLFPLLCGRSHLQKGCSRWHLKNPFLSALAKLQKSVISFVMTDCPPIRMEQFYSHWTDLNEIWYLRIFRESIEKIKDWLKCDKNNGHFIWKPMHVYDTRYVAILSTSFEWAAFWLLHELWITLLSPVGFRMTAIRIASVRWP